MQQLSINKFFDLSNCSTRDNDNGEKREGGGKVVEIVIQRLIATPLLVPKVFYQSVDAIQRIEAVY